MTKRAHSPCWGGRTGSVLELDAVDGAEPMAERMLRAVAHAGSWVEQQAPWAELRAPAG